MRNILKWSLATLLLAITAANVFMVGLVSSPPPDMQPEVIDDLSMSDDTDGGESEGSIIPTAVRVANARLHALRTVTGTAEVTLWENRLRYNVKADFASAFPSKFRLQMSSIFGDELDMGSNDDLFWYWARRSESRGQFYATHDDYFKTRLKTPFNPIWIMSAMGFAPIELDESEILEREKHFVVASKGRNASGEPVIFAAYVDKEKPRVTSHVITDPVGTVLASANVLKFGNDDLPRSVLFNWHEEEPKRSMRLDIIELGITDDLFIGQESKRLEKIVEASRVKRNDKTAMRHRSPFCSSHLLEKRCVSFQYFLHLSKRLDCSVGLNDAPL